VTVAITETKAKIDKACIRIGVLITATIVTSFTAGKCWCKTFTFQDVWTAVMNYMAAHITVAVSTRHPTIINCCINLAASICMTSFSTSTCCIAANSLDIMTATTLRIALSITKALSTMHPTCMFVIVLDTAAPVTSLSTVTRVINTANLVDVWTAVVSVKTVTMAVAVTTRYPAL